MTEQLKRTPLADEHVALGAKMVDFGGWYMPVQYEGIIQEHTTVRTAVGLFDVSHMGEVRVQGPDALAFLNRVTTNDVSKLVDGQAHYTVMTHEQGGIIDDLLIYRFAADHYLLVVNASTQDKDYAWLARHAADFDVRLDNESDRTGQIAIQGPLAETVLQRLVAVPLAEIGYYRFVQAEIGGIAGIVSRTGYTGEDGFECYVPADRTAELWRLLLATGQAEKIAPAGLGARDTLRLEARMHLYGNDMDEQTSPLEAGLGWVTKLKKEGGFIGCEALLAQKAAGITRQLVGFEVEDRGIARHGYPVFHAGQEIGVVTSGTHAPTLKKSIGLAYVASEFAMPGGTIDIQIRNKMTAARIVKGAFYTRS